jgi:hypothetical protein
MDDGAVCESVMANDGRAKSVVRWARIWPNGSTHSELFTTGDRRGPHHLREALAVLDPIYPFGDQVFDDVRLPIRGGQGQRRAAVVIRAVKVHAAGRQLLRLAQIALARRPTEVDDAFDARLILLQPRVALVVQLPRQPVVDVEVVAADQLFKGLQSIIDRAFQKEYMSP